MNQAVTPVISNREVIPGVYLIWVESPQIASLAKPGQFVMVGCGEDTLLPRPFSIHRRDGDKIALLFKVVGKGTAWLSQCKAGEKVDIFGPLGNGFSLKSSSNNLLLVAGGNGIAPIYFLAEEALSRGASVRLLYGTADRNRYPVSPDIKLVSATEDGTVGHHGMVSELLPAHVGWADQIFACGPLAMYQDMAMNYPQLRNKPVQVSLEVRMGCGRGVCYGCSIRTKNGLKRVCEHGPVFDLMDILWEELDF